MFSALRRLTSTKGDAGSANNASGVGGAPPPGLYAMSSSLQKKFAKGVQYNMKIVIKGDRNCGKTCLFRRLQGLSFLEEYNPTDEIQVANINWNYKTNDDVVKVEIWDIVDKAKRKRGMPSKLKIENQHEDSEELGPEEMALDASFVDVYKNSNGVIFVFDVTKNWTFDYVRRELPKVPNSIPILILSNHRDSEPDSRVVSNDTVQFFIEGLARDSSAGEILFTESSMRNGFGLKFVHKFFNLPFLQLQRDTLMKQLESNQSESLVTISELSLYAESDEANYDFFLECLSQKNRPTPMPMPTTTKPPEPADIIPKRAVATNSPSPRIDNHDNQVRLPVRAENSIGAKVSDSISNESVPVGIVENMTVAPADVSGNKTDGILKPIQSVRQVPSSSDILDFVPEFENPPDKYFLDDKPERNSTQNEDVHDTSDDDDKSWNPMVMSVVEDVQPSSYSKTPKMNRSDNNELLSSTEDLEALSLGTNSKTRPTGTANRSETEISKEKSRSSTKIGPDPIVSEIGSNPAAGLAKREKSKNKKRHRRKSKPEEDYNAFIGGTSEGAQNLDLDSSAYEILQ